MQESTAAFVVAAAVLGWGGRVVALEDSWVSRWVPVCLQDPEGA
jgi:hypothetical protein